EKIRFRPALAHEPSTNDSSVRFLLNEMVQPLAQVVWRRDLIGGTGKASSDGDADAAEAPQHRKGIAIGHIVAREPRRAASAGRLLHEGTQRCAFVRACRL